MADTFRANVPVGTAGVAQAEEFRLAEYSVTGSIASQIAVFGASLAQQHRKSQRDGWEKSLKYAELERDNMYRQADEMRHAAGARLAGAVVQGSLGIVGGVAQGAAAWKGWGYARAAEKMQQQQQVRQQQQAGATQDGTDSLQSAAARPAAGQSPEKAGSGKAQGHKAEDDIDAAAAAATPQTAQGGQASPGQRPQGDGDPNFGDAARFNNDINILNNKAMAINQGASALGMVGNAAGQIGKGAADFIAAIDDAQKLELEADKKRISAAANVLNQETSVHGEIASKALDIAGQAATAIQPPRFA